jgi:DNA-binding MarR family transcriptional regulator
MNANTLERSPLHLLHRTMQYAEYIFLGVARDLTPDELAVLITLAQHEGVSQHVISERMGIDHDTTTDLVVRLRQKGLLQRRRNAQDPGAYVVKLTVEGSPLQKQLTISFFLHCQQAGTSDFSVVSNQSLRPWRRPVAYHERQPLAHQRQRFRPSLRSHRRFWNQSSGGSSSSRSETRPRSFRQPRHRPVRRLVARAHHRTCRRPLQ